MVIGILIKFFLMVYIVPIVVVDTLSRYVEERFSILLKLAK